MEQVTLLGIGCDAALQLTREAEQAVCEAGLLIGASRILASLPSTGARTVVAYQSETIIRELQNAPEEKACVVYSGDTGYYSGARFLLPLLHAAQISARVLPGISSLQTMAARLGQSWQSWKLCSAHGTACDISSEIMAGKPCFFLTGGEHTPQSLCRDLTEAGLGELTVHVGENLCTEAEQVSTGTAAEFAEKNFASLSVLVTEPAPIYPARVPGIADDEFVREKIPMTKREVRAAALAALEVSPMDVCWDIGAGTGSVSVELALHCHSVWALERNEEALELSRKNRQKFGAWNLHILQGEAPEGLERLPKPDKVFVGGSGGNLRAILSAIHEANPQTKVCVSAIALETLSEACAVLQQLGYAIEITQIAVSRAKPVAALHLLMAQNPVFLITGEAE